MNTPATNTPATNEVLQLVAQFIQTDRALTRAEVSYRTHATQDSARALHAAVSARETALTRLSGLNPDELLRLSGENPRSMNA